MKFKTVLIAGAVLLFGAGGMGYVMVSHASQTEEFKVIESGAVVEPIQELNVEDEPEVIPKEGTSEQKPLAESEDKISIARDALMEYFGQDVSDLEGEIVEMPKADDYEGSLMVIFYTNPDDVTAPSYNVFFDPNDNFISISEVYTNFRDCTGGKKIVGKSVTVDEAKVMAEEFIAEKKLVDAEDMEYIGGKVTSEGRIHVVFKIAADESITVGIDTYDNQIKSFFKRSLEYGKNLINSRPEDAVG